MRDAYDQVAISINGLLTARFDSQLKRRKDKRLREFSHALPEYGSITATLSAPHVQLAVPSFPESVYFFLNFASGSFQYWTGFGPSAKQKTQDVTGWSVGFKTSIGLSQLATVPKSIADQISLYKPDGYSASQLLMGLSAAAVAELAWHVSKCPGLEDNLDLKFASQNIFKQYMNIYLNWLSTSSYSVLGYAIHVTDSSSANLPIPSFSPVATKCQIQTYSPLTGEFSNSFPTGGGLDMIIFEGMSAPGVFPSTPYDPTLAGNWVVGGIDASLAISKAIFWDQYLLNKLSELNLKALAMANDSYYWVYETNSSKLSGNAWYITDGSMPTSAPWVSNSTGATFDWSGSRHEGENSFFGGQWSKDTTTTISNGLTWAAGASTATITVDIKQNHKHWTGGHGGGTDTITGGDTHIAWSLTITLSTIKLGELSVAIDYSTPTLEYKYSSTQDFWDWGGAQKASYENAATTALKSGVDISSIKQDLTDALNNQAKFVFPGAGDFFMKNPTYNQQGDLLVNLSYIQKEIAIDDVFHLQVAPGAGSLGGKWLKVDGSVDGSPLVMVDTQAEATAFQVDNGNLVIDQDHLPTGLRAETAPTAETDKVQSLAFVTAGTFDRLDYKQQLQCSVTGSNFAYSLDQAANWISNFALDTETEKHVCLFKGDTDDAAPFSVFQVQAII
ncbi:hypothetical protein F66182_1171 [Fusarium sp. NRRL 66182]|nr:hypothetical protein F66182_1171 [Fusarium sp. NRRL 66182]